MRLAIVILPLLLAIVSSGCSGPESTAPPLSVADLSGDVWRGRAIAYSGYRNGQSPAGTRPTQDQLAEDLHILERHWGLIRIYGADRHGEDVLEVIRREKIELKVMLGIWLGSEPKSAEANVRQVADGIRLANEYADIVVAVNVGNEVLIEWTNHPLPEERLVRYVREVRASVEQPVTVADNYVWWRDYGASLAHEVDFITIHSYPLWERRDIDEGLAFTIENYEDVRAALPGHPIVIGEAGWATYSEGNLHVPRGGDERKQQRYHDELTNWAAENSVTVFFFEAFDEAWKGTGTEGHWGLFTADRKAKPVMQETFPDLMPNGPTSPAYPDRIRPAGPDLAAPLRVRFAETIPDANVNPMGPGLAAAEALTVEGAEGGTALRLAFNGEGWAGVFFYLGEYDASAATAVAMRIRLPDEVAQLELKLEGPETNAQSVNVVDYATDRDEAGWRTVSVPLTEFNRIDPSRLAIVGLWRPTDRAGSFIACEVLVDDVRFD